MPISLKSLYGGGGSVVALNGLQPADIFVSSTGANYGNPITVSGLDISATLTELCSVNVPSGKSMILLELQISSGLTTTAQATSVELEIDGTTVLSNGGASSNTDRIFIVGNNTTPSNGKQIQNLLVNTNFKLRAQKAAGTSVAIQATYILVEKQ